MNYACNNDAKLFLGTFHLDIAILFKITLFNTIL